MKKHELFQNAAYWISKIQIDLYNQLNDYMKENNLNRTQLAKKLGVSKGYISQVLKGDFNHRMSTFVELSLAINKVPIIKFDDLDNVIGEKIGEKRFEWIISTSTNLNKSENTELPNSSKTFEANIPLDNTSDNLSLVS